MFKDVIELLEGEAENHERNAWAAVNAQRSADEKRMAIAVLQSAAVLSGTEIIAEMRKTE